LLNYLLFRSIGGGQSRETDLRNGINLCHLSSVIEFFSWKMSHNEDDLPSMGIFFYDSLEMNHVPADFLARLFISMAYGDFEKPFGILHRVKMNRDED